VSEPAGDPTRGLVQWLLGGLAAGGIVLGLLVAAYAIGYHRGQHGRSAAPSTTAAAPATTSATPTTTTPATTQPAGAAGPVTVTPQLVARGKSLFAADGCSACHSLSGAAGAGPPLNGVAGSKTKLVGGATVTADDAYLVRALTDPDAQIVDGYHAGIMGAAIAGFGLGTKPDDVRALVAFLKSER
jgi:mono/diheme cytochrome c family protein